MLFLMQCGGKEQALILPDPGELQRDDMAARRGNSMGFKIGFATVIILILSAFTQVRASDMLIDDFKLQPETRWRFLSDAVMGGISSGQVAFESDQGLAQARMTGSVSTANNGGFIQIRMKVQKAAPANTVGIRLIVRGNDQRYFVHLRTGDTFLPWQFYQAGFDVKRDWTEVRLPLAEFKPSGSILPSVPRASSLTSIGIVAYGRNHDADISVREIGFY